MRILVDDLSGDEIAKFLEEHLEDMRAVSPPESKHALDLEGLRKPEITFWTMMDGDTIAGCGALKQLNEKQGEIKSMRTATPYRHRGIASLMLEHIIRTALDRGYERLNLETGSMDFFEPARKLYEKFDFRYCGPFADYKLDPNSVFMTRKL